MKTSTYWNVILYNDKTSGYWSVIFSYVLWGILPIYWKAMAKFPSSDILVHRIIWGFVFIILLLSYFKGWKAFLKNFTSLRELVLLFARAFFLGITWFIYVWGINEGYIIDCSFGYFIMPSIAILFGFIFLKERLSKLEIFSFFLALLGCLNLVFIYEYFPWLALILAISFTCYALLRKTSVRGAISELAAETAVLSVPASIYLVLSGTKNNWIYYSNISFLTLIIIFGAGVVTVVPILYYTYGIKRIKLNSAGILQYINPTCTFLLGVFLYKEEFSSVYFISFVMIWISIAIFTYDKYNKSKLKNSPFD